jgi:hypothetical protein
VAEAEVRRGDKVEIQQVRVTFPPRHRLKPQSENFFRLAHSAEEVRTERLKLDSVAGRGGELGRDENPAAQRLAQGLDSRYLVDCRSDDREVEAIHRANIAIEHLAEVKREVDHGSRLSHPCSIRVKSVEAAHCFGGGGERVAAGFIARSSHEGKARKHAIAKELQHLTAVRTQRRCQRLEYVVEHFNENRPRRRVGYWREAADIRVPKDGADALDRTTLDHTGMNTTAGVAAEIRSKQTSGNRVLGI